MSLCKVILRPPCPSAVDSVTHAIRGFMRTHDHSVFLCKNRGTKSNDLPSPSGTLMTPLRKTFAKALFFSAPLFQGLWKLPRVGTCLNDVGIKAGCVRGVIQLPEICFSLFCALGQR